MILTRKAYHTMIMIIPGVFRSVLFRINTDTPALGHNMTNPGYDKDINAPKGFAKHECFYV